MNGLVGDSCGVRFFVAGQQLAIDGGKRLFQFWKVNEPRFFRFIIHVIGVRTPPLWSSCSRWEFQSFPASVPEFSCLGFMGSLLQSLRTAGRNNLVTKGEDRLQCPHCSLPVVFLLGFRQVRIGNEAGMLFRGVIAFLTLRPAIRMPLRRPQVVCILCEVFGQRDEWRRKQHRSRIDQARDVVCGHLCRITGDGVLGNPDFRVSLCKQTENCT